MKMPFGKHRGGQVEDIPHDYLLWVLDNVKKLSPTLRSEIYCVLEITGRRGPAKTSLSTDVAGEWYRRMAREFHPDARGSHEAMVAVNRGREVLLELEES